MSILTGLASIGNLTGSVAALPISPICLARRLRQAQSQNRQGLREPVSRARGAPTRAQPVDILWTLRRIGFEAGFAKFMDRLMSEAPATPQGDFLAAWKAQVESEMMRPRT